jgi:hypothetical protein
MFENRVPFTGLKEPVLERHGDEWTSQHRLFHGGASNLAPA